MNKTLGYPKEWLEEDRKYILTLMNTTQCLISSVDYGREFYDSLNYIDRERFSRVLELISELLANVDRTLPQLNSSRMKETVPSED